MKNKYFDYPALPLSYQFRKAFMNNLAMSFAGLCVKFVKVGMEWGESFLHLLWPKLGQEEEIVHQRRTQYQSPVIRTSTLDKCHRVSKWKTQMMNWTKLHRKNNQILKEGTPLFPSDIKGTQQVITQLKCSSLLPFSVRVIKDMSELGKESQPGLSLPTGDIETFGPNKDMI